MKAQSDNDSAGTNFSRTKNLSVEVDDKLALDLIKKGHDIQWKNDKWLVDYTNRRIWIDAQKNASAGKYLGQIFDALALGRGFGNNIDVHTGESLKTRALDLLPKDPDLANDVQKLSPKETRFLLNLAQLDWNADAEIIRAIASFDPSGKGKVTLPITLLKMLRLRGDVDKAEKIEEEIKKLKMGQRR